MVLFADLDESEKSNLINETPDSWLRFMEYGNSSTTTKQPSRPSPSPSPRSSTSSSTKQERIEQSFAPFPLTHPDNPNVVAEAVWEVLPDEVNACFDYRLVVYFEGSIQFSDLKTMTARSIS